jgi:hypothetical protein
MCVRPMFPRILRPRPQFAGLGTIIFTFIYFTVGKINPDLIAIYIYYIVQE